VPEGTPEDQDLTPVDPDAPDTDEVVEGEAVPGDPAQRIIERFQVLEAKLHSGPLPSPEVLQEYDNVLPGCAERIVSQFETQSSHRQDLEKRMVGANILSRYLAQSISLLVVLAGIAAGTILILNDKDAAGLAAILTPLGVIAVRMLRNGTGNSNDGGGPETDEPPAPSEQGAS
jgi:uncharacterized membrane protein